MILTPASTSAFAAALGRRGRHGEHADDDVLVADRLGQAGHRLHGQLAHARCRALDGSASNTPAMWKPWSPKMLDEAIAWPSWPAPTSAMLCWPGGAQDLADLARSGSRCCTPPRACRTCRTPTGRGGSGWRSRGCTRRSPARRSSHGPASSPASAPADSARGGRRRRRSGDPKPTMSPLVAVACDTVHDQCSHALSEAGSACHEAADFRRRLVTLRRTPGGGAPPGRRGT